MSTRQDDDARFALLRSSYRRLERVVAVLALALVLIVCAGATAVLDHPGDHSFSGLLKCLRFQAVNEATFESGVTFKKSVSVEGELKSPEVSALRKELDLLRHSHRRLQRATIAVGSSVGLMFLLGAAAVTVHNGDHSFTGLVKSRAVHTEEGAVFGGDVTVKKNLAIDGQLSASHVKGDVRFEGKTVFAKDLSIDGTLTAPALGKVVPQYEYLWTRGDPCLPSMKDDTRHCQARERSI